MKEHKGRVLCADDDPDTCEMMTILLGESGYDVTVAQTAADGLMLARDCAFDLIILDWHFKDGSGIELCQMIRNFDPKTPILFYSGAVYSQEVEKALKVGAQGYMVKPTGLSHLLKVISEHTGNEPGADRHEN
jgi:DNA-binding response OmpR family regulator